MKSTQWEATYYAVFSISPLHLSCRCHAKLKEFCIWNALKMILNRSSLLHISYWEPGSSVNVVTKVWVGWLGFDSWQGQVSFLITSISRPVLGPTKPLILWVLRVLSLGVKQPGHEADHSPPSSAEIKNAWSCTSTPPYIFMAQCLIKHKNNFTFTIY